MNSRTALGAALLLSGVFLFWNRGMTYDAGDILSTYWASLFIIPLGIFFHWLYFGPLRGRGAGVLVPGGILLTVGIVCQISQLYDLWHVLWPGFILAPAAGLFELYWFGGRNRWLLIPIYILTAFSLIFFFVFSFGWLLSFLAARPYIGILMAVIGALLLIKGRN